MSYIDKCVVVVFIDCRKLSQLKFMYLRVRAPN